MRLGCSQILNGGDQNAEEDESKAKEQILVVKAESKSNKTYMAIIKKERLGKNTHVLISTSVLDNGVNLEDIDNIVVSDISKTKCLQMVGRARVSGPDDRKTLYVKRFGGDEVDRRIRSFDRQKSAYHSYNLAYGEPHNLTQPRGNSEWRFLKKYYDGSVRDWEDAKHWFSRPKDDPQKLYFNKIAESLLVKMIPQYKAIYDEMVEEGRVLDDVQCEEGVNYTGQKYLEYQLSWFGKTYCADDDITFADKEKAKKEFIAFLDAYVADETQISSEDQTIFKHQFTKLYDVAFGREDRNLHRDYGIRKMNGLLFKQNLCYEIVSQSSHWEVRKLGLV